MSPPKKPTGHGISTRGTMTRVIDGDTVEMNWFGRSVKIRLLACWVDDGSEDDRAAAEFLQQFIGQSLIVWVPTTEAKNVFSVLTFDRVLAWIWSADDEESINEAIVRNGWGTAEKPKK